MSSSLQDYLKRYTSSGNEAADPGKKKSKKRKKGKQPVGGKGIVIVDNDSIWQRERNSDDDDEPDEDGDGPAVIEDVEVKRMQRMEVMKSHRPYLSVANDGSGWVTVQDDETDVIAAGGSRADNSPSRSRSPQGERSLDLALKRRSIAGDISPPRRRMRNDSPDVSPRLVSQNRSSPGDISPPRRKVRNDSANMSPPRKKLRSDSPDISPPRRRVRNDSPDMLSPRRKLRSDSPDISPPRRRVRNDSPDVLPPRKKLRSDSPDISPPRRRVRNDSPDMLPPRRKLRNDSPDISPPRRRVRNDSPDRSPPRRKLRNDSPDLSPPRKGRALNLSPPRRRVGSTEDLSPPRKSKFSSGEAAKNLKQPQDISPPRRKRGSGRTMADGASAGLQTEKQVGSEAEKKRSAEAKFLANLDPSASGRGAETVFRDKRGRRLEGLEEMLRQQKGEAKPPEQPLEWGKGLVQKKEAAVGQAELDAEASKPFARYRDDEELDKSLKERVRWGDPMAHLVKQKVGEMVLEDLGAREEMKASGFIVPQNIPNHSWLKRGVGPPSNRYEIKPGRHWDGVDRSNGFEQGIFKHNNEKRARDLEAYLWSVSDM